MPPYVHGLLPGRLLWSVRRATELVKKTDLEIIKKSTFKNGRTDNCWWMILLLIASTSRQPGNKPHVRWRFLVPKSLPFKMSKNNFVIPLTHLSTLLPGLFRFFNWEVSIYSGIIELKLYYFFFVDKTCCHLSASILLSGCVCEIVQSRCR